MLHPTKAQLRNIKLPAVLRITGDRTALAAIAAESHLVLSEAIQSQRERRRKPDALHPDTTFNLTVSDADGDSVRQQITDAELFLTSNEQALRSMIHTLPRYKCTIDFSWDFPRESIGQFNQFPPSLLSLLADLDIMLVVSVYGTAN